MKCSRLYVGPHTIEHLHYKVILHNWEKPVLREAVREFTWKGYKMHYFPLTKAIYYLPRNKQNWGDQ
jgi:hypothetical protein